MRRRMGERAHSRFVIRLALPACKVPGPVPGGRGSGGVAQAARGSAKGAAPTRDHNPLTHKKFSGEGMQ